MWVFDFCCNVHNGFDEFIGITTTANKKGGTNMEKERCNEANCPCKKVDCVNHGRCCDCIMNHRKKGTLVSCMRMMLEEQEAKK